MSMPPLVCASQRSRRVASSTPGRTPRSRRGSGGLRACRRDNPFARVRHRGLDAGTAWPHVGRAAAGSVTLRRCPSRPKPVTSVAAWTPTSSMASHAARLSVAISSMAAPMALRCHVLLGGGGDDSDAERLGEHERIARFAACVGDDARGMNRARDGQAVDRLVGPDGVTADDVDPGLSRLVGASPQDVAEHAKARASRRGSPTRLSAATGLPPIA